MRSCFLPFGYGNLRNQGCRQVQAIGLFIAKLIKQFAGTNNNKGHCRIGVVVYSLRAPSRKCSHNLIEKRLLATQFNHVRRDRKLLILITEVSHVVNFFNLKFRKTMYLTIFNFTKKKLVVF